MSIDSDKNGAKASSGESRTVIGACPLDCPDACSWIVTVENGVATKLRGNSKHPHTRKGLCVKVNPYLDYAQHPDRLMYPLRRVGKKGDGHFERISWEEALSEIADRMAEVIDEFGAEAIWPYRGSGNMGYVQGITGAGKRLFNRIGASNHNANICAAAAYPALDYTIGTSSSMDPLDVVHSKTVIIWGAKSVSSNQHFWAFVRDAKREGAKIVVIDPVATRTARRSDRHVQLKPGTDGALALGLMAQLVESGQCSGPVSDALGWDQFNDEVLSEWTVDRAAVECGIEPSEIRELAELMANGPTSIRLGMGMQRHAAGGQAARLISCLPLLTGDYHRLGGGLCYSTSPLYPLNKNAAYRPDLAPGPVRTLVMTRLGEGLVELNDPPVKALFVMAGNPVASNPQQEAVKEGLSRTDLFTVVIDSFATDTVDYADIVLPSTMQTEHLDIHDSVSHLFVNYNEPAVEPPGDCLSHTEIFRRLALAMGLNEPELLVSDEEILEALVTSPNPAMQGVTVERLRSEGFVELNYPKPFIPFADGFDTPSRRFEFTSATAESNGHGLLPHYNEPLEATRPNGGSLALIAAANHYLMNSMFANSSAHVKAGPPVVAIHPDDAAERGLDDGMTVDVSNARGSFTARLVVSERTRRGVASSTKGHWPKLSGGATVNATTLEADADMGAGALFHDNQVVISPSQVRLAEPEFSEATR